MDHTRERKHSEPAILQLCQLQPLARGLVVTKFERVEPNIARHARLILEPASTIFDSHITRFIGQSCTREPSYYGKAAAAVMGAHVRREEFPLVEENLCPCHHADDLDEHIRRHSGASSDRVGVVARDPR